MKVILNPMIQGLSGRWGNLVFVTRNGRTYAFEKPVKSSSPKSMNLIPVAPILSAHGKILGAKSAFHVRTTSKGTIFTARNGNPQRNPSPAQLLQQERMRQAALHYKTIMADPRQLAQWQQAFLSQTRYRSIRSFIFASVLSNA